MRVRVDLDACEGHGRCYALAPRVFEPDATGHCVIKVGTLQHADLEQAERAVANCPEEALSIVYAD